MHGVYFGQMSTQSPPGPHLDTTNSLHIGRGLHQCSVAGLFPRVLFATKMSFRIEKWLNFISKYLPEWHSSKLQLLVVSYLTHSYWHAKAGWGRGRICIYNQNTSEITVTSSVLLVFQQSDRCRSILTQKQKKRSQVEANNSMMKRGERWWLSKAGKRRERKRERERERERERQIGRQIGRQRGRERRKKKRRRRDSKSGGGASTRGPTLVGS